MPFQIYNQSNKIDGCKIGLVYHKDVIPTFKPSFSGNR
jgi:hypothetical protein